MPCSKADQEAAQDGSQYDADLKGNSAHDNVLDKACQAAGLKHPYAALTDAAKPANPVQPAHSWRNR